MQQPASNDADGLASPAATGAAYLRIEGVTKRFGEFTALDGISLNITEGEFICFLGPSGCGKTTLLRAIAGLDIQSTGLIHQAGRDISALPPSERDFGIVFQSYALFPNLSVFRNIAYGLENRKTPRPQIEARVNELLSLVGLADQGEKYPAQLSGGQQQRVALARAIATSPGLLLLDEPLSALDARVRQHLRLEVRQLQRRLGITTIMVTHDQEEALTMADRIVVMNHGVIEQVGTPQEIYREPASVFVAEFIGTMNLVSGEVCAPDRVRVGTATLAFAGSDIPVGSAVTVAIRPEDVTIRDVDASGVNAVEVDLQRIEFLGAFARVTATSPALGNSTLELDVSANLMRDLGLRSGSRLTIRLPADRIRLFAAN